MPKSKGKYRTDSLRASWWDYGKTGCYFVTICTYERKWFFGEVVNKNMDLSPTGKLVEKFWREIPFHFPHVSIGAYVVMPNHLHGILNFKTDVETLHRNVYDANSIRPKGKREHKMGKMSPASGSLGTVIRSYKSAVTKQANRQGLLHGWQTNFFDRIIRSDLELHRISAYIKNNPDTWEDDEFFDAK